MITSNTVHLMDPAIVSDTARWQKQNRDIQATTEISNTLHEKIFETKKRCRREEKFLETWVCTKNVYT